MNGQGKPRRELWFNWKYLGQPRWDTGISPPELIRFIEETPPGRALDLGCGTGTNLRTLAQAGWEVVGVDQALISVWKARRKFRQEGLAARIVRGRVTDDLGLSVGYDLVLDIGCFHNLTETERSAYRRLLVDRLCLGGTFLLYEHCRMNADSFHGIDERDVAALDAILNLCWRADGVEKRSDGSGRMASVWLRYERPKDGVGSD